jgi:hypothetical protein
MKPLSPMRALLVVIATLLVGACATNQSVTTAPPEPPAQRSTLPGQQPLPTEPQMATTPGGVWPPRPEDALATETSAAPLPKMFNTDGLALDGKLDPKAELKVRAVERWALLIANRGEEAFLYLTPGYQKTHDKVRYADEMAGRPVRWFRAAFDHSECASETSCEVTLLVDFRVRMSAGMGITESFAFVKERWIATNGVWYHLPPDAG